MDTIIIDQIDNDQPSETTDAELMALLEPQEPARKPTPIGPLVKSLRQAGQDHEFYPTTDEIIRAMVRDIRNLTDGYYRSDGKFASVLDIGAGNGKVLMALKAAAKADQAKDRQCGESRLQLDTFYAIEKSSILCRDLDPDILVIGTDFHEQSLLSKQVDIIFCNPPYSEYEQWTEKIIRQSASKVIYLVIPRRWEESVKIKDAIRFRDIKVKKIGEFDFEDAEDRQARAKVHLLKLNFEVEVAGVRGVRDNDPFERFFKEQFADLINKFEADEKANAPKDNEKGGRSRPFHQLVPGEGYPDAMVNLYRGEMANVERNYRLASELDVDLLREFEINPTKIMACLKARLGGLRGEYWSELFSRMNAITDRLTSKSRQGMLNTLQRHVQVDFTVPNIYEIIVWAIKNANRYIDAQLIDTYEVMVDKCNVVLYKSNKRTWVEDRWRYSGEPAKNSHYALDYRIVTHQVGGVECRYSSTYKLCERGGEFLGDLMTLARNLGFQCNTVMFHRYEEKWEPGEQREYYCVRGNKRQLLFDVRAFKNGNLHIRLNQQFILALNVEYGRLKGWLRSGEQAADELKDEKAADYFKSNLQLCSSNPALLLTA